MPNPIWRLIQRIYHRLFVRRAELAAADAGGDAGGYRVGALAVSAPGRRVPAQARRGQYLGHRDDAADHLAAGRRSAGQSDAARDAQFSRSRHRGIADWAVPTAAPRPPDFSTSSSRSISNPNRNGRGGMTKPELVRQIEDRLSAAFPGVSFDYSQNIEDNINEALSGVKAPTRSRCSAPTWRPMKAVANKMMAVMGQVPGITDLAVYPFAGAAQPADHSRSRGLRALRA